MGHLFNDVINRKGTGSSKWDNVDKIFRGNDLLPLWVADMDFLAPVEVIEAMQKKIAHGIFGYPVHSAEADAAVINWLKRHYDWQVEQQSIVFTSGVIPTMNQIIQACTAPQDEIIIQTPVYPPFFSLVMNTNRKLLKNPLQYQDCSYTMDFEHLESIINEQTKMLILCNPHNPVGRVWSEAELIKMAEICKRYDLLVISDEIHADIVYEGKKHIPIASLSEDMSKRTFTCLAPSKTFNLAEFHTSYIIAENPALRTKLKNQLTNQFLSSTNSFGELVTTAAYRYGETWLKELRLYIKENLEFVKKFINTHIPELSIIEPEGTYLVWIDCRKLPLTAFERKKWLVEEAKIALNHGPTFGKEGEFFERMNIACPRKTLEEGLTRLKLAYARLMEE